MTAHGLAFSLLDRLALWDATRRQRASGSAVAVSSSAGRHLFLGIFLAGLSDPRSDRTSRNSSRRRLSSGCRTITRALAKSLVLAHDSLVVKRERHVERAVLGRPGSVAAARVELLAARDA